MNNTSVISRLKDLHVFLSQTFRGASIGPWKIDDFIEALEKAIKILEDKEET